MKITLVLFPLFALTKVLHARTLLKLSTRANSTYGNIAVETRDDPGQSGDPLRVDLGYAVYEGFVTTANGLNTFQGIRYADPPTGLHRFQRPQKPSTNRKSVLSAKRLAPRCPQALSAPFQGVADCPGLASSKTLPKSCQNDAFFRDGIEGDEDCLFLSVYAPPKAHDLPVLVYIHGGGYGAGSGGTLMDDTINDNGRGFVGIAIQYRLGAFGFLASDDVHKFGALNAGLLDQELALEWVQKYISLFGGDPRRVTIMGDSAGGGSVVLLDTAYSGTLGTRLFRNTIANSPYGYPISKYSASRPSQAYYALAAAVGCSSGSQNGSTTNGQSNSASSIFACLQSKDTSVLQYANAIISTSGVHGTWAFTPVVDGTFIAALPSRQLFSRRVNSEHALASNLANEGPLFVMPGIKDEDAFDEFLKEDFPLFTGSNVEEIKRLYPVFPVNQNTPPPRFSTEGNRPPSALQVSPFGYGQQQRAYNLYAEATFICPSYWFAGAHASTSKGSGSYHYQISVPPAEHASDVEIYFGPRPDNITPDFQKMIHQMIGHFVMYDNPSVSALVANGESTGDTSPGNPLTRFPQWSSSDPVMLNFNLSVPGLRNQVRAVNASSWEAGRGSRCGFWRKHARLLPL